MFQFHNSLFSDTCCIRSMWNLVAPRVPQPRQNNKTNADVEPVFLLVSVWNRSAEEETKITRYLLFQVCYRAIPADSFYIKEDHKKIWKENVLAVRSKTQHDALLFSHRFQSALARLRAVLHGRGNTRASRGRTPLISTPDSVHVSVAANNQDGGECNLWLAQGCHSALVWSCLHSAGSSASGKRLHINLADLCSVLLPFCCGGWGTGC